MANHTIILYDDETKKCLDSLVVEKPEVEGQDIKFVDGGFRGIQVPFIVIEGEHLLAEEDDVTELLPLDKKAELKSEVENIRTELAQTQQVLNDMMFGGL